MDFIQYYKAHPGKHPYLMAWAQNKNAMIWIKARQLTAIWILPIRYYWPINNGEAKARINYLQEAQNMIAAIMQYEINPHTYSILLSDGIEYDSKDYFDTRSSDFMPANFKAFENATQDDKDGEK